MLNFPPYQPDENDSSGILSRVRDLAFSPDGTLLAAACRNGVYVWQVANLQQDPVVLTPRRDDSVAFSPDSWRLAAGNEAGDIAIWTVDHLADDPLILHAPAPAPSPTPNPTP